MKSQDIKDLTEYPTPYLKFRDGTDLSEVEAHCINELYKKDVLASFTEIGGLDRPQNAL